MSTLKVYNSSTGQWEYAAIGAQGPTGPAGTVAVEVGGPITLSGTSTAATLGFNSTGFVKTSIDNVLTSVTQSTSYDTGALVISGGVGIAKNLYVQGNIDLTGNININGTITGSLTEVNVTNLNVSDSLIYLADNNLTSDSVDIGIYGAYRPLGATSGHMHTGLIRDHNDSGIWKLVSGAPEVSSNDVDFGVNDVNVTFDVLKIKSLVVTDAAATRTTLGLATTSNVSFGTISAGGLITTTLASNRGAINISSNGTDSDPSGTTGGDVWSTGTSIRALRFNAGSGGSKTIAFADSSNITGIANANIASGALISDTKLDTISTALKVSNSATTATSANTNSAIVARDGSGNFSAGTITATGFSGPLTGNASTASGIAGNQTANTVYAGPASGSATTASFRALVAADLPTTINSNTNGSSSSSAYASTAGTAANLSASTTTLASNVVNSSLTSVGALTSLTVNGAATFNAGGNTINNDAASTIPLVIRGYGTGGSSTQSVDLQQWNTYNGAASTTVAKITKDGVANFTGVSSSGNSVFNYTTTFQNNTVIPLITKNLGGSADLFQLQNSVATVLGGANAVGQTYTGSTTPLNSSVGTVYSVQINSATEGQINFVSATNLAAGDFIAVAAASGTSVIPAATYLIPASGVLNSGTANLSYVKVTLVGATITSATTTASSLPASVTAPAQASITPRSAGTKGLVIRPISSTGASMQEWQNTSGTSISSVASNGGFAIGTYGGTFSSNYSLSVGSLSGSSGVLLVTRGSTSQTGDLLQLQQSTSPYILGGVNAAGQFYTGSTATAATIQGSSVGTISATTVTSGVSTIYQLAAATGLTVGDLITVPVSGALTTAQGAGTNLYVSNVDEANFRVTALTPNATANGSSLAGTMTVPAQVSIAARNSSTVALAISVPSSTGANMITFGTGGSRVDASGNIRTGSVANTVSYSNSSLSFATSGLLALTATPGSVVLKIQNSATPTTDLTQWVAGSTTVARVDSSGGWGGNYTNTPSHRNVLHNGGFNIWQRYPTFAVTSVPANTPTYVCDRWIRYNTVVSSISQSTDASGYHFIGVTSTTPTGSGTSYYAQRIEAKDSWHLAGNTVTLSGLITAQVGNTVTATLYYWNGGVVNGSSDDGWPTFAPGTLTGSTAVTVGSFTASSTTNTTKQSFTFTIPAAAIYGLQLVISTTQASSDTLGFNLKDMQLELGSVATPFERRPHGYELALCQRYYERITNNNASSQGMFSASQSTSSTAFMLPFVSKRTTTPTITFAGTWYTTGSGLAVTVNALSSITITNINEKSAKVTASAGGTSSNAAGGVGTTAGNYVEISSEL